MARYMHPDDKHVYRAVITIDGRTALMGPFTSEGAAKALITREQNSYWNRDREVSGRVESSPLNWSANG